MSKTLAGWALGVSIATIVLGWVPLLGWLLWIAAVVFAIVAIVKCKKPEEGRGMAIAALVITIIATILGIVLMVVGFALMSSMGLGMMV